MNSKCNSESNKDNTQFNKYKESYEYSVTNKSQINIDGNWNVGEISFLI
jgi:hypothetical protein